MWPLRRHSMVGSSCRNSGARAWQRSANCSSVNCRSSGRDSSARASLSKQQGSHSGFDHADPRGSVRSATSKRPDASGAEEVVISQATQIGGNTLWCKMQTQFSMSPDIRLTIEGCSGAFAARAQLSLRLRAFPHIPGLPDAEVPKSLAVSLSRLHPDQRPL